MHIRTIITVAMLGMLPHITLSQENPSEAPIEQQSNEPAAQTTTDTSEQAASPKEITLPKPEEAIEPQPQSTETATPQPENTEAMPTEEPSLIVSEPQNLEEHDAEQAIEQNKIIEPMPEPIKEEPVVIPEESVEEAPAGIDTVSLENPQGNWLFKRIWWERAEERYEKIRILVDAVWESRNVFFVKRNELDRNVLDPFYLNIGINQGELQTKLNEFFEFFEKHRQEHGDLSEQERSLYETIESEEEALQQLRLDVEAITNLDHAIDDALGMLMNQINRVRQFERQAWDNFKGIAHLLDDTKARELYYMIEGAARNIKNISTYLEQDFFNHFSKLINEATKHVSRVQNQIEALKEKGINFKRQTEQMQQTEEQQNMELEAEEEEEAPKPKLGWFGWIFASIKNIFGAILSIIRIPYDMIFGK